MYNTASLVSAAVARQNCVRDSVFGLTSRAPPEAKRARITPTPTTALGYGDAYRRLFGGAEFRVRTVTGVLDDALLRDITAYLAAAEAQGLFEQSRGGSDEVDTRHRSSTSLALPLDLEVRIKARARDAFAPLPVSALETPLQVVRYAAGQQFGLHHDSVDLADDDDTDEPEDGELPANVRMFTAFLYVNSVPVGGRTLFPVTGDAVRPVANTAAVWPNLTADGRRAERRALHRGEAVPAGLKYGINLFYARKPGVLM